MNNIKLNDIHTFKLVSGEEVIAKVTEIEQDYLVLTNPVSVAPGPQGLGLMQSMFTADPKNNINISKQHVMMCAPVIEQMVNHYIQTTTGIQPVTKGGIIT